MTAQLKRQGISSFNWSFSSSLESIERITNVVQRGLDVHGLSQDVSEDIVCATTEAAINAIKHGNHSDPEKPVQITMRISDRLVVIRVKDQGTGFDPGSIPDPTSPENLLNASGRGIMMMHHLMDRVFIGSGREGTTLVMAKRRAMERAGLESEVA
jgi:serine/threonine-protein kinase RsbW